MAIKPTPNNNLFKSLVFDGVDSRDYGIYITGDAVFNSPERDVEMIEIPGRNGAYALDKGRFSNIEVSYPAGIAGDTEADFRQGISAFRNALASRKGYKRLEDDYNPDEYRMAVYKSGLEVTPKALKAGEFTITFDCQPQRFLKSGEIQRTIGGAVTNTQTESGAIVSVESDGGDAVTSLVAQIEPVQAGSGDPSPTNVRPITGWTAANVFVIGKNLFDKGATDTGNGYHAGRWIRGTNGHESNDSNYSISEYIPIKENTQYTVSGTYGNNPGVCFYDENKQFVSGIGYRTAIANPVCTFTTPSGVMYARFSIVNAMVDEMQLEFGGQKTDYIPYTGHTYPVSFGSAGTVYGGTVDVVTGVLTVTHKMHIFDGAETLPFISVYNGVRFRDTEMNTTQSPIRDFIASTMKGAEARGAVGTSPCIKTYTAVTGDDTHFLFVCMPDATDAESANAWLQAHPTQVVYPITPKTYNLTAQQVELLTGDNNIWADTGDITLTYGDDPNKIVNPTLFDAHPLISFSATADGSFTMGDYTISVVDALIGRIPLSISKTSETMPLGRYIDTLTINNTSSYQTGDAITLDGFFIVADFTTRLEIRSAYFSDVSGLITSISRAGGDRIVATLRSDTLSFVAGTASTVTLTATLNASYRGGGSDALALPVVVSYDGARTITITATVGDFFSGSEVTVNNKSNYSGIVDSTVNTLTETIYLDCETGNAYSIIDGSVVSMNNHVGFGAELPVLPSGVTTFSRSGASITSLSVIPRWWEV